MWKGRSRISLVVAGLVTAFAGGWGYGTWSTCVDRSCTFDADVLGAVGSWVGGLAAAAAATFAAYEIRTARMERHAAVLAVARACTLRAAGSRPDEHRGHFNKVNISFENKTTHPVTDLVIKFDDGPPLGEALLVNPGAKAWGVNALPEEVGLEGPLPKEAASRMINKYVRPRLVFEFSIGPHRFRREDNSTVRI